MSPALHMDSQRKSFHSVVCLSLSFLTCHLALKPITRRQTLDSSKLKEFADDNFRFDENGRKLSKQVENTVGKGEIARYKQFLLFPVFSKGLFPRAVKRCHCVGMGKHFKC